MVGDASNATGGREVTGQNADGSRLAGAVRSEEADDLSLGDSEADIVNGQDGAKVFGEMSNLNHRANPVQESNQAIETCSSCGS